MWMKMLQPGSARQLERAMDFTAARSEVLMNNLANINTPHYKRKDVDFSTVLEESLAPDQLPLVRTNPRHVQNTTPGASQPRITIDATTSNRFDGNNVDAEFESTQIAENTLYYQALSDMWRKEMSKIKSAIEGR